MENLPVVLVRNDRVSRSEYYTYYVSDWKALLAISGHHSIVGFQKRPRFFHNALFIYGGGNKTDF